MYGGRTWKCPNLLNIGLTDLIILLKDIQLNFQEEFHEINSVYDQPFLQYSQLKLLILHIVLSWTNLKEKFFQK